MYDCFDFNFFLWLLLFDFFQVMNNHYNIRILNCKRMTFLSLSDVATGRGHALSTPPRTTREINANPKFIWYLGRG